MKTGAHTRERDQDRFKRHREEIPMFGKKTPVNPPITKPAVDSSSKKNKSVNKDLGAPAPLKPLSRKGSHGSSKPVASTKLNVPRPSRSLPEIPTPSSHRMDRPRNSELDPNCLVIGRGICLRGEITSCEKLIVEGVVDLTLPNAHSIEISPSGHLRELPKLLKQIFLANLKES